MIYPLCPRCNGNSRRIIHKFGICERCRKAELRAEFLCPSCGSDALQVIETRPATVGVRRRRKCSACQVRVWTVETVEDREPIPTLWGDVP